MHSPGSPKRNVPLRASLSHFHSASHFTSSRPSAWGLVWRRDEPPQCRFRNICPCSPARVHLAEGTLDSDWQADGTVANGTAVVKSSRPVEESQFKRGQAKPVAPKLQSKMSLAQLANQSATGQERASKAEAPAIAVEVEAPKKEGGGGDDDDDEPTSQFPELPEGAVNWLKFLICAPLLYSFALTIPDCRMAKFRKCFGITFTMAIVRRHATAKSMHTVPDADHPATHHAPARKDKSSSAIGA